MTNPFLTAAPASTEPRIFTDTADDPFLSITQLQDPALLAFHATKIAEQITGAAKTNGFAQAARVDLTPMIVDVILETTIAGASTLEVHLADPFWLLLQRDAAGDSFIDVAEDGWLQPVDVEFPHGSDCWWRLCAADISLDTTGANVVMTFESRGTSRMRELLGPIQSFQGELLSTFVERRVRDANGDDDKTAGTVVFVNLMTPPPPAVINDGAPLFSPKPNRHSSGGAASSVVASAQKIADELAKLDVGLLEKLLNPSTLPTLKPYPAPPLGPAPGVGSLPPLGPVGPPAGGYPSGPGPSF